MHVRYTRLLSLSLSSAHRQRVQLNLQFSSHCAIFWVSLWWQNAREVVLYLKWQHVRPHKQYHICDASANYIPAYSPSKSRRDSNRVRSEAEQAALLLQGVLEEVTLLQEITESCRAAVRAFVEDRTDSNGRVSQDSLNNFARSMGFGEQPWTKALKVRYLVVSPNQCPDSVEEATISIPSF